MSAPDDIAAHRPALTRLAEMTSAVLERVYVRVSEVEGDGVYEAVTVFTDLGRSLRLTIALDLRLSALMRAAMRPAQAAHVRSEAEPLERGAQTERPEPVEREREQERETDGFPMDPLGRIEAFERVVMAHPDLDPDRSVTAQIIELKTFLDRDPPPEPEPRDPGGPPAARPSSRPGLTRPPNRAERRRMRRASG